MFEKINQSIIAIIRGLFIRIGYYGSAQMCAGFFHEVQVPKELQQELEKSHNSVIVK